MRMKDPTAFSNFQLQGRQLLAWNHSHLNVTVLERIGIVISTVFHLLAKEPWFSKYDVTLLEEVRTLSMKPPIE